MRVSLRRICSKSSSETLRPSISVKAGCNSSTLKTVAPTMRGFAGQTKALKPLRQAIEEPIPFIGRDAQASDDFAWRMRHALDTARGLTR